MATLKITLILLFLILWIKRKQDLGAGLLIGSFVLGILSAGFFDVLKFMFRSVYATDTIDLIVVMILIFYFIEIWSKTGGTASLCKNLNHVIKDSPVALVIPPAIIGLIPIMGGAMVSAPLVKDSFYAKNVSPAKQTFQNFWFRHIWEYAIPTYPGVIISAGILGVSYGKVFALNFPLTIFAIIIGSIVGLTGIKYRKPDLLNNDTSGIKGLLVAFLPLFVILVPALVFKVPLFLSLAISIILMALVNKISIPRLNGLFIKSFNFNIISVVVGIMAFKYVMEDTGVIVQMSREFISWKIPVLLLLFLLPFITGFITGITQAFVAISFPLLINYLSADNNLLTWAYVSGYMGVLLSPVHVCLVLTKEYFGASWKDVYKILIIPCLFMLAAAFFIIKIRG
ncbi:MAG: DUF401 family protein [Elusimicrobia bacterium]|nr:DUF401 family protein [Elusimicrobiota bacterium]MBU2614995.1 DUF401 family protein [Elusimicrobiota bacterium]